MNDSPKTVRAEPSNFVTLAAHRQVESLRLADVQVIMAPLLSGEAGADYVASGALPRLEQIAKLYSSASVAAEIEDVATRFPATEDGSHDAARRLIFDLAVVFFTRTLHEIEATSESHRSRMAEIPEILSKLLSCYFLSGRGVEGVEYCVDTVERLIADYLTSASDAHPRILVIEKVAVALVDTVLLEDELERGSRNARRSPPVPPTVDTGIISFLISWRDGILHCVRNIPTVGLAVPPVSESATHTHSKTNQLIERLVALGKTSGADGCPSFAGICYELAAAAIEHESEGIASACRRQAVRQFESAAKMQAAAGLPGRAHTARERARKLAGRSSPAKSSATHRSTKPTETT